jgi:hypothetical protein
LAGILTIRADNARQVQIWQDEPQTSARMRDPSAERRSTPERPGMAGEAAERAAASGWATLRGGCS